MVSIYHSMGRLFTDKFSLLHFATGIIVYYWGMSFTWWFILHALYEYLENTPTGMKYINLIKMWPGGKNEKDTIVNSIGDQFYALLGWVFSWYICNYTN